MNSRRSVSSAQAWGVFALFVIAAILMRFLWPFAFPGRPQLPATAVVPSQFVTYGKSKPFDAVTLSDRLEIPIWIAALDEESFPGQDESWQKPITNTANIGADFPHNFPTVTFKVIGTDIYGDGDLDLAQGRMTLNGFWQDGEYRWGSDVEGLDAPVTLELLPSFHGQAGVRLRCGALDLFWACRIL